jgi:ParB family chromosome partitioning protein
MRLLSLPEEILAMVESGTLSAGHARTLLPLNDKADAIALANEIVRDGLSVRETERRVKLLNSPKRMRVPKKRDTFFDEAELSMSQVLGRKAKIRLHGKEKGSVEIEFFSREDLSKLLNSFDK